MNQTLPALFLLLLAARTVGAAFTRPAQWRLDIIQFSYAGTPCFRPGPNPTSARACNNSTLIVLLDAHIKNDHGPGLSIAYYDPADGSVLGGAGWADWDSVVLPVGVCMSGAVDTLDDTYSTTCRFTFANNDHDISSAHAAECAASRPQLHVTDGCYTLPPPRARFRLDDSASGILTIIGLIIALPSIVYGTYRWYNARQVQQEARIGDGQAIPLVRAGGGEIASHEPLRGEPTRLEG